MSLFRFALVAALGLGLSSTGCLGNSDPLVEDVAPPRFETLGNGSGVGSNGLAPEDYHANLQNLLAATQLPLLSPGAQFSDELLANGILLAPKGPKTLAYAVGCAFDDDFVLNHGNDEYVGEHLLNSTASWALSATGLTLDGRQDLFACIAARMNPFEDPVDILLSGAHVPPNGDDESKFTFDEALWIVKMEPVLIGAITVIMPHVFVWPLGDMKDDCRPLLEERFQSRYCGLGLTDCGITVRYDDDACTKSLDGAYTCDLQPALKTRLKPGDVSVLHGGCAL